MKQLEEIKIITIKENIEYHLLNDEKLQFSYDTNWKNHFPKLAGIYAIFENSNLVYIGQTSELRSRMSDIRRTYNHTFRKKIGLLRLNGAIIKSKFSNEIEDKLTAYMVNNCSFTYCAIPFGRLEVESFLVQKYQEQLINSKSVRGIKKK
jgi:hypothetical protein